MPSRFLSSVFVVIGMVALVYAVLLVVTNDFETRCSTYSSGEQVCEGVGVSGAPMAMIGVGFMVGAVATRPKDTTEMKTLPPFGDRYGRAR